MAKILILIGGHLCTAPRPQKEAGALTEAGHDVLVSGPWFDSTLALFDQELVREHSWNFQPLLDFRPARGRQRFATRLEFRLARDLFRYLRVTSPPLFGYGTRKMFSFAREHKADLTIVHSEGGLWAGQKLLQLGYSVGVDFEDWFSRDLPLEARRLRPIKALEYLERQLLEHCRYCITTSHVLSSALAQEYATHKPGVVYNVFPWEERSKLDHEIKDRKNKDLKSVHWFSQSIGPGRGIETLFGALPHLSQKVEIHLRGTYPASAQEILEPLIPPDWRPFIFFHPPVTNTELLSRVAEHDIGLALEVTDIPNKDLTISNKLFLYLLAGVAVVASATQGQAEVMHKVGDLQDLVHLDDEHSLARRMNYLLENPEELARAKQQSLVMARDEFCWEQQKTLVQTLAQVALNNDTTFERET